MVIRKSEAYLNMKGSLFTGMGSVSQVVTPSMSTCRGCGSVLGAVAGRYRKRLILVTLKPATAMLTSSLTKINVRTLSVKRISVRCR